MALKALYQAEMAKEQEADLLLERFWRMEEDIEPEIKAFTSDLVRGILANISRIDESIGTHAKNWEIGRMAVVDRNVMRIACYELFYRDDIPPKVSINEAVDMAKRYGDVESGKFVNGVLDKISKQETPNAE